PLQARLPFPYDFERIVDDFVFMCFFVGNDFLPHLPCMDIRDGAVDYLLLVYAKLLPSLGGYLTKPGGDVDLDKVDVILAEVGAVEESIFQRRVAKERENTMRDARRLTSGQRDQVMATVAKDSAVAVTTKRLKGGEGAAVATAEDDDDDGTKVLTPAERQEAKYQSMPVEVALKYRIQAKEEAKLDKLKAEIKDHVRLGEPGWKTRYYEDKLKADDIEIGTILSYVEGLCWVMRYYYTGVASWQWFYPFHYAPFASDLKNIDRFKVSFDVGQPFCPFEQLMGVFPADSRHAIPKPYQWLLTDAESPIIDFYPQDIPVDPNGKAMPWLWVVLLPFIDETRLLDAMRPINDKLSDAEKKRNERFGKELLFFHASIAPDHPLPSAEGLQSVALTPSTFQMFGNVHYVESSDFPLRCTVPSPQASKLELQDVPNNQCLSFHFEMPAAGQHLSATLEGAIVPPPVLLTPEDRTIAVPKLGFKSISIVDLAGAAAGATAARQRGGGYRGPWQGGGNNTYRPQNNYQQGGSYSHQQNSFNNYPQGGRGGGRGPPSYHHNAPPQAPPPFGRRVNAPQGGGYYQGRGGGRSPPRRDFGGRGGGGGYQPDYNQRPPPRGYPPYQQQRADLAPGVPRGFGPPPGAGLLPPPPPAGLAPGVPRGFGPPRPNLDALRQGLRNMHAQRETKPHQAQPSRRYDR
ncbi:hypothetical protein DYB30_009763, partial [Aphanomyces astaci]